MPKMSIHPIDPTRTVFDTVLDSTTFEMIIGLLIENYNADVKPDHIRKSIGAKPAVERALGTITDRLGRIASHHDFARMG